MKNKNLFLIEYCGSRVLLVWRSVRSLGLAKRYSMAVCQDPGQPTRLTIIGGHCAKLALGLCQAALDTQYFILREQGGSAVRSAPFSTDESCSHHDPIYKKKL